MSFPAIDEAQPTSSFPDAPLELLCEILEHAIENETGMARKVMILSKSVKTLMEPVIYRTASFRVEYKVNAFLKNSSPQALSYTRIFIIPFPSMGLIPDDPSRFPALIFEKCRNLEVFYVRSARGFCQDHWAAVPRCLQRLSTDSSHLILGPSSTSLFPNLTHLQIWEGIDWKGIHYLPSLRYLYVECDWRYPSVPLPAQLAVCICTVHSRFDRKINERLAISWIESMPKAPPFYDPRIIILGRFSDAVQRYQREIIQPFLPDNDWELYYDIWSEHWRTEEVDRIWTRAEQIVEYRREKMKYGMPACG